MRLTPRLWSVAGLGVVLALAPVGAAPAPMPGKNSWPMFGGTNQRNMANTVEQNIPSSWSVVEGKEQNVKWSVALGSWAHGSPVVADGRIFIGTNNDNPRDPKVTGDKGVLLCFEEATGKFLWQRVHDKLESGRMNDWPEIGIVSCPVVEGDRLYYVSNRAEVICANTVDGSVVWKLDMIGRLNVFPHNASACSPLVAGAAVFVVTGNGVDEGHINIPNPEAPSFIAINKKNGELLWKNNDPTQSLVEAQKAGAGVNIKKLVDDGKLLMHAQWSSPVYAEPNGKPQIIFPGGDGWMRAFDPKNGELIWKFDCNPKGAINVLGPKGTRNNFLGTPVVWKDKLYIGVGQSPNHHKGVGHLWCIDVAKNPTNKEKDLSPVDNDFDPKAAANKDSGLVWHYGGFLDPKPLRGRQFRFGRTMSSCAVHDGLCYVADFGGSFYCFDALTGDLQYEKDTKAEIWSSPTWIDGRVYLGNEDGQIWVFKDGKKMELVNTIDMNGSNGFGTVVRTTPVACNGVLYVTTRNPCKLWAVSPGGK